ncbi:MAG: type II secretion system protein [Planctomycetota bacterium]
MNQRGMTLIEILVSIGLLTAIIGAAGTWIRTVGRTQIAVSDAQHGVQSVDDLQRSIREGLLAGDVLPRTVPKVECRGSTLLIRTRSPKTGQTIERSYRHDFNQRSVVVDEFEGHGDPITLATEVRSFQCDFANDSESAIRIVLELNDVEPIEWIELIPW